MLKDKRVFVSGGAGVIGMELVDKLLEQGAIVIVGDLKPKPAFWDERVIYRQGDLNLITQEELDAYAPEYFFHLAATFERSIETYDFWGENFRHNIRLSHHLMSCLKDSPTLRRVVFASSYLIYNQRNYTFDRPADRPVSLKETDEISPRNLCGAAKLLHELELEFLGRFNEGRFTTVCARIFRSYGKRSRDVISRWIRMLLNGETLQVYKPEGMFDYIYAGDVAEGLLRLAVSPATGIVNLGSGRARRVSEVIDILRTHFPSLKAQATDMPIPFEASQADMERFRAITGWMPEHRLEDAIPLMIRHEREMLASGEGGLELETGINVLVTSISKKVPLLQAVRKALSKLGGNNRLFGADLDPNCIGRYFVDEFWQMPRTSELPAETLIDYCRANGIRAIIPTRDGELGFFAALADRLRNEGIHVMVSSPESVNACVDKLLFARRLREQSIPAIPTAERLEELDAPAYAVKERYGAGSHRIGLGLAREDAVRHAASMASPIFQPYVSGREYSIDLYRGLDGRTKGAIARTRDRVVDGESQVTTTVSDPELEALGKRVADALDLYGHAVLQVLVDEGGGHHVIECNCRVGGASRLAFEAGLDSLYWFLLEASGQPIAPYPFARSKREKRLVRYAEDRIECR
jgi:carbamoyl-phosphate synthase large subunit